MCSRFRSNFAICVAFVAAFAVSAPHAATRAKTSAQLDALRAKIEQMTQQVNQDATQRDRLSANLRSAETSLGQARGTLDKLEHDYADRAAHRNALAQQRAQQQQQLDHERSALAGQLRAAYLIGQEEPLKLLLNQQDPLHSARLISYYGYFGRARADFIGQIAQHLQQLDALDAQLAQEQSALAALRGAQQQQLSQLQHSRDQRKAVLVSLETQAHSREASLARLKTQQADLEKLLKELDRSLKSVAPPDNLTAFGRLHGQLNWPVNGHVTAQYGEVRASGVRWDGIVVATERGTPVRAVSAGRVVYADWLPGMGLLVIVDHGEGYLSLYGHNDRLFKAVGDNVAAGDQLAAAGDTGGRASPELYFEIRRDGRPVDPSPWFRVRAPQP